MNDIIYKRNITFSILSVLAICEFAAFIIFITLDFLDIGTYREQDALGGSLVFLFLFVVTIIYLQTINFSFKIQKDKISINKKSFMQRSIVIELPYREINEVEVKSLSKKIILNLNDEKFVLPFMHTRFSGDIPDTATIGNIDGSLREMLNLQNEILRRKNAAQSAS